MPRFEGIDQINAPRQQVWAFLMDPHRYTACSGGAMTNVRVKDERHFQFDLNAMGRNVTCQAQWAGLVPEQHAELTVTGGTMLGKATLRNTFDLSDAPNGGTAVHWSAEAHLSGALSAFEGKLGPRLEAMNRQAMRCVEEQLRKS